MTNDPCLSNDSAGTCVASYTCGEHTVTNYTTANIGNINPFRYRGYYFDTETGFYYLNARYYDPQIKRFLSADSYINSNGDLTGYNMYAYCSNNPVMYIDPTGEALIGLFIGIIITAIVVDTVVETTILLTSDEYKAKNVFNGKTVEIPNSAFFNNPIAQYFYADYLYENVKYDDGTKFFTGDVYDIIGEWQVHNVAFWMTLGTAVVGALALDPIAATAGTMALPFTFKSGMDLNLGSSLESEKDRWYVYYPSQILKWLNKIGSLNCLNWGD